MRPSKREEQYIRSHDLSCRSYLCCSKAGRCLLEAELLNLENVVAGRSRVTLGGGMAGQSVIRLIAAGTYTFGTSF